MLAITMEKRIRENKSQIDEIEQQLNKITKSLTEIIVIINNFRALAVPAAKKETQYEIYMKKKQRADG